MGEESRRRTNIIKGNLKRQDVWSEKDISKLVSSYKRNPCLWKRNDPFYLTVERKRRAYERIQRDMTTCSSRETNKAFTVLEIMMKLREVRKFYVTQLNNVLRSKSTYCRYVPTTKWFYELHDFLFPYLDSDEISELQSIADRWIAKCNRARLERLENGWRGGKCENRCETMSKRSEQLNDKFVEHTLACGCRRKGIRSRRESPKHPQTAYMTSVIHERTCDTSCSSSGSSTNYATSWSDTETETTSSSTIIRENRLFCERGRTSESSESGSTCDPSNVAICGTKRSSVNPKRRRTSRTERNEIFTKRRPCQSSRIKPAPALRPPTEITKIRYGCTFRPNSNLPSNS